MNPTVLLLGAAAAFLYFTQGASAKTPTAPTHAAGGPVFPAANPNATATIPVGQTVYSSSDGVQFWHYVDANGFDHYVAGLNDVAFITNEASRTMNRRTGALVSNDSDHRPSIDNPVAIQINLGLNGLQDLG